MMYEIEGKKIRDSLLEIEAEKDDPEVAHGMEDDLWLSYIQYMAKADLGLVSRMAVEILKTQSIEFSRWYA